MRFLGNWEEWGGSLWSLHRAAVMELCNARKGCLKSVDWAGIVEWSTHSVVYLHSVHGVVARVPGRLGWG